MPKAENAFELENAEVKILEVKTDSPKSRDEDRKPTLYLHVVQTGPNSLLSLLHPSLKSAFYQKSSDGQTDIEAGHTPERKFDNITKPVRLDNEFSGYAIEIEHGFEEKSNLKTDGVTLDRFKATMLAGGSVLLHYRIGLHVDAPTHGKLSQQKNEVITISLTAPEVTEAGSED